MASSREGFGHPPQSDQAAPTAEQAARRQRRRYQSRSSEEVMEEMNKHGVSYRIGWPNLPPLPIDNAPHNASSFVGNSLAWLNTARLILNARSIRFASLKFAFRVPHNAQEDIDDPAKLRKYLTLVFEADTEEQKDEIARAVIDIRMKFKDHAEVDQVLIECIDYRASTTITSHGIEFDEHAILDSWDVLRPILREILEKHGCRWILLELLRRGLFDDPKKCHLTIVITTPTAGNEKWYQEIIPLVLNASMAVDLNAQIEILAALNIEDSKRRYESSTIVDERAYEKFIAMGSSISTSDKTAGAGTVGGSITLSDNTSHGLTNWHAVRDNRLDAIVSKTKGALFPNDKTLKNSPQTLLSPATIDHEGRLGYLQVLMQIAEKAIDSGSQLGKTELKKAQDEFKVIENAPRLFGSVYAGSGCRTVSAPKRVSVQTKGKGKGKGKGKAGESRSESTWPLDWALVKISDVSVKNIDNVLPAAIIPSMITRELKPPTGIRPLHSCDKWSNFEVRQHRILVAKVGRTSGWTFGKLNAAFVEFEGGNQISTSYEFTKEFEGSCFGVVSRVKNGEFLQSGDSGSILVHDPSGTQLGLLFGSATTEALMIPHRLIFEDIKLITGKRVIRPEYIAPEKVGLASYQLFDVESDR